MVSDRVLLSHALCPAQLPLPVHDQHDGQQLDQHPMRPLRQLLPRWTGESVSPPLIYIDPDLMHLDLDPNQLCPRSCSYFISLDGVMLCPRVFLSFCNFHILHDGCSHMWMFTHDGCSAHDGTASLPSHIRSVTGGGTARTCPRTSRRWGAASTRPPGSPSPPRPASRSTTRRRGRSCC